MQNNKFKKLINSLEIIWKNNQHNPQNLDIIENNINNYLPKILIKDIKNLKGNNQPEIQFITHYLNSNNLFFISELEVFIIYDQIHYSIYNEDDIQYKILTTLNHYPQLRDKKHDMTEIIINKIKQQSILTTIPESTTIQNVISLLYPTFFKTKQETKYFLTVIGDNILKKNDALFHFISPNAKNFLIELSTNINSFFKDTNTMQTFKFKYHEHDFNYSRLINTNEIIKNSNHWSDNIKKFILDYIVVAAHYSHRYKSSEILLEREECQILAPYTLFLKNNTLVNIIKTFLENYISPIDSSACFTTLHNAISWKNIFFIWKKYLKNNYLPNIAFSHIVKTNLIKLLTYDDDDDSFLNITSQYLPSINCFINFWNKYIVSDETEFGLELSELLLLYKQTENKAHTNIVEQTLLELINHFYPNIIIENEKIIINVRCTLFDKKLYINEFLNIIKNIYKTENIETDIAIYKLYADYMNFNHETNKEPIIVSSKQYFENYINIVLDKYIENDITINNKWIYE